MALVSWSDRIVDSLKRAFDKHSDGESPAEIWIAFIGVPPTTINDTTATRINSAKKLAEACKPPEPHLFFHEVVFEWAIPEKYILHQLSLQTLMKRGLEEHNFSQPSTAQVRRHTARELQGQNPKEIGYSLGSFARRFGARTPLQWVSHQLFRGCVRATITDNDVVRLDYAHGQMETVDFQYFRDLDNGIDTSLNEWWLADTNFFLDLQGFKKWNKKVLKLKEKEAAIEAEAVRIEL